MSLGGDFRYGYPTGWYCPQCHRVNAPSVLQCSCAPAVVKPFKTYIGTPLPTDEVYTTGAATQEEWDQAQRADHLRRLAGHPAPPPSKYVGSVKDLPDWGV